MQSSVIVAEKQLCDERIFVEESMEIDPLFFYSENGGQQNSFNGNTIQLGFTLSDQQMFNPMINSAEIILHSIIIEYYPGPSLASYI